MGEMMVQINLVIPKSMKDFLDSHKEINRSKEFRDCITERYLNPRGRRMNPLVVFVGTMGPIFGVVLIAIGLTPTSMETTIRGALPLLGGILALGTAITLYFERRRVKKDIGEVNE